MTAAAAVTPAGGLVTASLLRWRCRLSLTIRSDDPATARRAQRLLAAAADDLEATSSRFVEGSELSAVNRTAGSWTEVSWSFVKVVTAAITAAERSGGLVDPCLGRLVDAAGYRTWRDGAAPQPARDPLHEGPAAGCWRRVEVRPAGRRARMRVPTCCELDLGAVAKAWLADQLVARVVGDWGCDALADMGGDVRAVGVTAPWTVAADPELPGWQPHAMGVTDAGLATSGQGRRRWRTRSGGLAHHIIDPRTGRPADTPWWTASVLAADAAQANTAATAAMVLGAGAPTWLTERGLDAWLVPAPGQALPPHELGRWPADDGSRR